MLNLKSSQIENLSISICALNLNKLIIKTQEKLEIDKISLLAGEFVDPWNNSVPLFWTNERVLFNYSVANNELTIKLIENPFYTYLRVYYSNTNQNPEANILYADQMTPDNLIWWNHVTSNTKGVAIYFNISNEQPIPFPEEKLPANANLFFTPSPFLDASDDSVIDIRYD